MHFTFSFFFELASFDRGLTSNLFAYSYGYLEERIKNWERNKGIVPTSYTPENGNGNKVVKKAAARSSQLKFQALINQFIDYLMKRQKIGKRELHPLLDKLERELSP